MDILPAAASDTGPLNAPGVLSAAVAASAASTSKRPDPSSNRPDAASNSPEVASNHADGTGDRAADESPLAVPPEPTTLLETGISRAELESLVLKILLQRGAGAGTMITEIACVSRNIVSDLLDKLRTDLLVTIKATSGIQDFVYQLTEAGFKRAQQHASRCNFVGPAPVQFDEYVASIYRQSLQRAPFTLGQLRRAMASLVLQPSLISQIGSSAQRRPRLVPVRVTRQRENQHCRAGVQLVRPMRLDSANRDHPRRTDADLRSKLPRSGQVAAARCILKYDRPLGAHSPAHNRRGRRAHDRLLGNAIQHGGWNRRGPRAAQIELRHAGNRRLRPAAREQHGNSQSPHRAAGKALRLSVPGERPADPGSV